jgi:hypothetical protein
MPFLITCHMAGMSSLICCHNSMHVFVIISTSSNSIAVSFAKLLNLMENCKNRPHERGGRDASGGSECSGTKVAGSCCAMLCCAVLCCAVLCCAVLCCAMLQVAEKLPKAPAVLVTAGEEGAAFCCRSTKGEHSGQQALPCTLTTAPA